MEVRKKEIRKMRKDTKYKRKGAMREKEHFKNMGKEDKEFVFFFKN